MSRPLLFLCRQGQALAAVEILPGGDVLRQHAGGRDQQISGVVEARIAFGGSGVVVAQSGKLIERARRAVGGLFEIAVYANASDRSAERGKARAQECEERLGRKQK